MSEAAGITEGFSGLLVTAVRAVAALPVCLAFIAESCIKTLIPKYFKRRSIAGKTVLITGAGTGIGRELAILMAKKNARVLIWGRNMQNLLDTRQVIVEDGGFCDVYQVDVTESEAVYATADEMLKKYGKIDILVNNAGVVTGKNLLELKDDEIRNTFNVNSVSHFYTTRAFLPRMIADNSGHIVTVASMAGYIGVNKLTDYCASKFAAVGFSESLALELKVNGHSGIATTLVCSYYINTGMFKGVKSSLFPVMDQTAVAGQILDAIETRRKYCLPSYGGILCTAYTILPNKVLTMLAGVSGFTTSMNKFQGRHLMNGVSSNGATTKLTNGVGNGVEKAAVAV